MNSASAESIPVLLDVLETMTFMNGIVMAEDEIPSEIPGALHASLTFSGPASGIVDIWSDLELLETIAELLGDDESATEDTLGEILNVFTGQILTTLGDECIAFDLGIPVVKVAEPGEWCGGDVAPVGVFVDGMPIIIQVSLKQ